MISEERLAVLERFSAADAQDLCADVRLYREALQDIYDASRDEGMAAMINWMRGRAAWALQGRARLGDEGTIHER